MKVPIMIILKRENNEKGIKILLIILITIGLITGGLLMKLGTPFDHFLTHDYTRVTKQDHIDYLKKNDIKVVLMKDKMHLKLALIDSKIAIFGSTNWTKDSFEENYELVYLSEDKKTIETLITFIKSL